jgi:predicted RNA-binding Zn ribbon-like protein
VVDNTGKTLFAGYMALPENVSRAGTLHLIGGQLALDFANTASGRGTPTHLEHLREPLHVVEWAHHADVLNAPAAARLRHARLPPSLLKEATRLRNLVHGIGEAIASKRRVPEDYLAELSSTYTGMLRSAKLLSGRRKCHWSWENTSYDVLGPIAHAAVELLMRFDHARIKQCAGHECGWLFYDHTKNSRRWCDMKVCGNRAKIRRARKRKAAAP